VPADTDHHLLPHTCACLSACCRPAPHLSRLPCLHLLFASLHLHARRISATPGTTLPRSRWRRARARHAAARCTARADAQARRASALRRLDKRAAAFAALAAPRAGAARGALPPRRRAAAQNAYLQHAACALRVSYICLFHLASRSRVTLLTTSTGDHSCITTPPHTHTFRTHLLPTHTGPPTFGTCPHTRCATHIAFLPMPHTTHLPSHTYAYSPHRFSTSHTPTHATHTLPYLGPPHMDLPHPLHTPHTPFAHHLPHTEPTCTSCTPHWGHTPHTRLHAFCTHTAHIHTHIFTTHTHTLGPWRHCSCSAGSMLVWDMLSVPSLNILARLQAGSAGSSYMPHPISVAKTTPRLTSQQDCNPRHRTAAPAFPRVLRDNAIVIRTLLPFFTAPHIRALPVLRLRCTPPRALTCAGYCLAFATRHPHARYHRMHTARCTTFLHTTHAALRWTLPRTTHAHLPQLHTLPHHRSPPHTAYTHTRYIRGTTRLYLPHATFILPRRSVPPAHTLVWARTRAHCAHTRVTLRLPCLLLQTAHCAHAPLHVRCAHAPAATLRTHTRFTTCTTLRVPSTYTPYRALRRLPPPPSTPHRATLPARCAPLRLAAAHATASAPAARTRTCTRAAARASRWCRAAFHAPYLPRACLHLTHAAYCL